MSGPFHGLGRTVRVHRHGCAYGVVLRQAHSRGRLDPPAGSSADLQDEGRSVAGHECRRGSLGNDVTVVQDGEPVDRPLGLPHVVIERYELAPISLEDVYVHLTGSTGEEVSRHAA